MEDEIPGFLVCSKDGETIAEFDSPLRAAALVMVLGPGATIRDTLFRGDVLWCEGAEQQAAEAHLGHVVGTVLQRRRGSRAPAAVAPPEIPPPLSFD